MKFEINNQDGKKTESSLRDLTRNIKEDELIILKIDDEGTKTYLGRVRDLDLLCVSIKVVKDMFVAYPESVMPEGEECLKLAEEILTYERRSKSKDMFLNNERNNSRDDAFYAASKASGIYDAPSKWLSKELKYDLLEIAARTSFLAAGRVWEASKLFDIAAEIVANSNQEKYYYVKNDAYEKYGNLILENLSDKEEKYDEFFHTKKTVVSRVA